jgi:catechol 2,3-dioxygenase-like lactoylglutathione lyase family enzyme
MMAVLQLPLAPRLHHVGIIQPDMEAAAFYMNLFGQAEEYRGFVAEFECWCIFLKAPPGETAIELVVPTGGSLARFNRGAGGLHHYAYRTADIAAATAALAARDIGMMRPTAVKGAGDFLCNFVNPLFTRGIVVEFVQPLGPA